MGYDGCPFIQNRDTEDPDRLIQIPEGIPIKGVLQYDFYVSRNRIMLNFHVDFFLVKLKSYSTMMVSFRSLFIRYIGSP